MGFGYYTGQDKYKIFSLLQSDYYSKALNCSKALKILFPIAYENSALIGILNL